MKPKFDRRTVLLALTGLATAASEPARATLANAGRGRAGPKLLPTPRQTRGPFYPTEIPRDHDADLTKVDGRTHIALGETADVYGRVLSRAGQPVPGARVEIWQCDSNGRYHHPGDQAGLPLDPGFQGFGRTITGPTGKYRFRTIRPVKYPSRTPHIHFLVQAEGFPVLVTQMYVEGEPQNDHDFLFQSAGAHAAALLARFELQREKEVRWTAAFDLILNR